MGRVRKYSREQGDRTVRRAFSGFLNGMNVDSDPCALEQGEMAYLLNTIGFRGELRVRPGYSASLFAGVTITGTPFHSIAHPATGFGYICTSDGLFRINLSTNVVSLLSSSVKNCWLSPVGNELFASNDSSYFITENGGTTIRVAYWGTSVVNPSVSTDLSGNWEYRFLFTYARVATIDGVVTVLQESPSKFVTGTTLDDFATCLKSEPMSQNNFPMFGSISNPGDPWTHIGVYRTLNVGIGDTGANLPENGSEAYYRLGFFPFVAGQSLDLTGYRIGQMVIGSGSANQFRVGPYYTALGATDRELLAGQAPLLTTRLSRPIPPSLVVQSVPGFIVTAKSQTLYYSQTSTPANQFVYDPATQFIDMDDEIGAVCDSSGYLVVGCHGKTALVSHTSYSNNTNETLGLLTAILSSWKVVDYSVGIRSPFHACAMDAGKIAAVCSDNAVRVWDGTSWSRDISENKVETKFVGASDFRLGYDSRTGILLAANNGTSLRYGLSEDYGKGWSEYSDSGAYGVFAYPSHFVRVPSRGNSLESWKSVGRLILGDSESDSGSAIKTEQWFPGCVGEELTYYCRANEFSLSIRPGSGHESSSPVEISGKFYAAGTLASSERSLSVCHENAHFARFLPAADGSWLQARTSFYSDKAHRILAAYFHYQVQDRQVDVASLPQNNSGASLASGVIAGFVSHFPLFEIVKGKALTGSMSGSYVCGDVGYSSVDPYIDLAASFTTPSALVFAVGSGSLSASVSVSGKTYAISGTISEDSLVVLSINSTSSASVSVYGKTTAVVVSSAVISDSGAGANSMYFSSSLPFSCFRAFNRLLTSDELTYLTQMFQAGRASEMWS